VITFSRAYLKCAILFLKVGNELSDAHGFPSIRPLFAEPPVIHTERQKISAYEEIRLSSRAWIPQRVAAVSILQIHCRSATRRISSLNIRRLGRCERQDAALRKGYLCRMNADETNRGQQARMEPPLPGHPGGSRRSVDLQRERSCARKRAEDSARNATVLPGIAEGRRRPVGP
jgi:hypothetical protein